MVVAASWCFFASALAGTAADVSAPDYVVVPGLGNDHEVRADVPSLIYLAMEGIALDHCAGGDINAAQRCTDLVPGPTVFPAWGTAAERAAVMQALHGLFADFDVTLVDEPPLSFVPHMLVVVGGTSSLIGQQTPSCGIATLVCGGQRRDLVSIAFGHACGGWESPTRVASTVAQETAHNLGLEHVNIADDVMFPTVSQVDQTFRDACLDILTPDYDDDYVCPDVHALDCPEGAGDQQNSHAELLRLLGSRKTDPEPPTIVTIEPADGATFERGDSVAVTARIEHETEAIGLRWTWLDGPAQPSEVGPGITRCTNRVCDLSYERDKSVDSDWDFLALDAPPSGVYVFQLELADTHGHLETATISFEVLEPDPGETEPSTDTGSTTLPTASGGDDGCGCHTPSGLSRWTALLVALGLMPRRRRTAMRMLRKAAAGATRGGAHPGAGDIRDAPCASA